MSAVHIHAPPTVTEFSLFNARCIARAGDGRVCGGRRFMVRAYEWYGPTAVCWWCGAIYTEGELRGRTTPASRDPRANAHLSEVPQ